MSRGVRITAATLLTLLLLGIIFIVFWLMDKSATQKSLSTLSSQHTAYIAASSTPTKPAKLPSDVPLYVGISWGKPLETTEMVGTTTVNGIRVVSASERGVTDISGKTVPIEEYYHTTLLSSGWQQDESMDADGAGSSSRVYRKGSRILVLSYSSLPDDQNQQGPLECPCSLHFAIFVT